MKYAVVTGTSKGLGESVAKLFMEAGINVIGISRSKNGTLPKHAEENHVNYQHFSCDLGDIEALEETFVKIAEEIYTEDLNAVYLINNAGVVDPIDQAMNVKNSDLIRHVHINTIAPIALMNLFLKKSVETDVPLYGANVTSGAAERPTFGWSAYSSSKASINMYTRTVALEQEELNTENKVIAFSPGIMDTGMQEKIRTSSKEQFTDVDTFKNYKEKNLLRDTDAVAGVLVDILTDEGIRNGEIYNVKDYL
ncbi:(S)-benzoin forming benzil reductase [Virgibacillus sediminis]|uniref:(S)-benzoin forming benzil reductase n=1 Tax=Virgibacillus sediminis TaxID=202260 RepID=A0ABV7A4F4_9BACI